MNFNVLFCIYPIVIIQYLFSYNVIQPIIYVSKYTTKVKSYYIYFSILFLTDLKIAITSYFLFFLLRYTVNMIKHTVCQQRPYNKYPQIIQWYKKHKLSYSFPSQSMCCINLISHAYQIVYEYNLIKIYFRTVMWILALTRIFRGLHYIHDLIISIMISDAFASILYLL